MGFAGQVFAARVAVGLATPSQQQLSAAGALISGFANRMYKRSRTARIAAAQQSVADTEAELKSAQAKLAQFQQGTAKRQIAGAAASMKGIAATYEKGSGFLKKGALQGVQTFAQKGYKGVASKLFAGVPKTIKDADKAYRTMINNFFKMNKDERQATVDMMNARVANTQSKLDDAKAAKKDGHATQELIDDLEDELRGRKQLRDEMRAHHSDAGRVANKDKEKETKLTKDVTEKTNLHTKAKQKLDAVYKKVAASTKKLTAASYKLASTIKTNFSNALRDSVSVLTAFYYKLNQNTQELISFERELMNANSVFNLTNSNLFNVGESITQFGQEYGLAMQNGATGLYQLASAGLSASESMKVLPNTLKLSMAVAGDHNTISKLTAQTLFGFNMEMDQAGILTDKFAHVIQKSLIEYTDLTSAIKFALPFFTATGQSVDQLLGALEILTNRALEAGIAGRGLRQALSEFAEGAEDSAANFRQMGVEILDVQGAMLPLTEIAQQFSDVVGTETVNNTELLTALIQDLNVRGATAFIHLVQNADEFAEAVYNVEHAGGELDEMVRIQNASLQAQVQIIKNNIQAIFFFRDATYEGTEYLNAFHEALSQTVQNFRDLIVEEKEGTYQLTLFGQELQNIAVAGMEQFVVLATDFVTVMKEMAEVGLLNLDMLKVLALPLKIIYELFNLMGPAITKLLISLYMLNMVFGLSAVATFAYSVVKGEENKVTLTSIALKTKEWIVNNLLNKSLWFHISTLGIFLAYRKIQWMYSRLFIRAGKIEIVQGRIIGRLEKGRLTRMEVLNKLMKKTLVIKKLFTRALWRNVYAWLANAAAAALFWIAATAGLIILIPLMYGLIKALDEEYDLFEKLAILGKHMWDGMVAGIKAYIGFWVDLADFIVTKWGDSIFIAGVKIGHFFKMIWWGAMKAKDELVDMGKAIGDIFTQRQYGGTVFPRAAGGPIGRMPYLVGERGPEIFMPSSPGRIVANKDLNSPLTQSLMDNAVGGGSSGRVIYADTIVVDSADLKNSKVGIDVFA